MAQITAQLVIPVNQRDEGKQSGDAGDKTLAALGDASNDGDHAKDRNKPKQALLVTHFLQVKTGEDGTQKVRPRQKETDTQTEGAQVD